MDHIFEQKFVRENQQLQVELAKLNKQVKELQEQVSTYEQLLSEIQLDESGIRRLGRLAKAEEKARRKYNQFAGPRGGSRVEGGIHNVDMAITPGIDREINKQASAAADRLSSLEDAKLRAQAAVTGRLDRRLVKQSAKEGATQQTPGSGPITKSDLFGSRAMQRLATTRGAVEGIASGRTTPGEVSRSVISGGNLPGAARKRMAAQKRAKGLGGA